MVVDVLLGETGNFIYIGVPLKRGDYGSENLSAAAIGHTGRGGYGHGLHLAYKNSATGRIGGLSRSRPRGPAKAQDESGAAETYADYEQMLREQQPDIVSVGPRWTDRHLEMVLACLEAGPT